MAADRQFRWKQTGRNNKQMEGRMEREADDEEGSRKERVGTEEEEKILNAWVGLSPLLH